MMKKKSARPQLSADDLSLFCWQVSLLLESGIALADGMESVLEGFKGSRELDRLNALKQALDECGSLYEAMQKVDLFPAYAMQMTRVGEQTGRLDEVMRRLSAYYAQSSKVHAAVRSAVSYPLMLMLILAVVIVVILTRALPVFERVYAGFGADATAASSTWIHAGSLIGWIVLGLIALAFIGALVCFVCWRGTKRDALLDVAGRLFPFLRRIENGSAAWHFSDVLATLLNVGYPLDRALEVTADVLDSSRAVAAAKIARDAGEAGEGTFEAVEKTGLFDAFSLKMIRTGFAVGRSDAVMEKVSLLYQEDVEERIEHALSLVEPILVSVLAVVIGCILLAVLLPLVGILASFI